MESLFAEAEQSTTPVDDAKGYADRIVEKAEQELKSVSEEQSLRNKEKAELLKQLHSLEAKLRKNRNARNHRASAANEKAAETRSKLRNEIALVKDRLQIIAYEEQGSSITPSQIIDKSRKS